MIYEIYYPDVNMKQEKILISHTDYLKFKVLPEDSKKVIQEKEKLVIVITCIVVMCANMFFLAKFNDIDRGLDAVYEDMNTNHQEIRDIIQFNKTPEK